MKNPILKNRMIPSHDQPLRQDWFYFLIPLFFSLVFILISNHVWEDFLITFRFSRHLANGDGLVYHLNSRVHGFTSVFNTLIPAFFDWIYRGESIYPALWGYRIVSMLTLSSGCLLLARTWRALGVQESVILAGVLLISMDVKTVSFSTNGQEIAFMVFFIALAFRIISKGLSGSAVWIGICGAGFMYTRPDGFIYATVLFGFGALFSPSNRWGAIVSVLKGGLLTIALYLPWMCFIWSYYGSPIPNTITAKVGAYTPSIQGLPPLLALIEFPNVMLSLFNPIYDVRYFEPYSVALFAWMVLGLLFMGLIFANKGKSVVRTAGSALLVMVLYLSYGGSKTGIVFPWYKPAVCFLGYAGVVVAYDAFAQQFGGWIQKLLKAVGIIALALALFSYVAGVIQLTSHQGIIENGVRKAVGLWLKEHAKPTDTVFSEPIGYIGFYSGLKIYDWPGLQSPEVVERRNRLGNSRSKVIQELMPDWLVLRPGEFLQINKTIELNTAYEKAVVFDQSSFLDEIPWLPGHNYHYFDAKYIVLHLIQDHVDSRIPTSEISNRISDEES